MTIGTYRSDKNQMKTKTILLVIFAIIILAFTGWLLLRDSEIPIVETIIDGLPFGSGEDINIPALGPGEDTVGETTSFDESITSEDKLFRISNTPVAGFVVLNDRVRYVDRATGHIFDATLPTSNTALEKNRVTNTTLPKIYEAHFRSDGSEVLLRSIGETGGVESMTLTLTPPSTTSTSTDGLYSVSATSLRGDIDSPLPGTGNVLFYVLKDTNSIVSSTFTGNSLRTLFNSEFDNWRLGRAGNSLLVYTKASADAPGFAYLLNSSGGSLSKILGPLNGLTAVTNSNNTRTLYSYFESGKTKLSVRNSQSGASSEILPATLTEKCVWSNTNNAVFFCGTPIAGIVSREPDNWYKGMTHFSDYVWRFDTESEIAQLVSNPKMDFDIDLDVFKPTLSNDDSYLIFINKRDLTLWSVKLD